MQDDELEAWRRQWMGPPDVVVDLIRRVERETVAMRMGKFALFAPGAVAFVATVFIAMSPSPGPGGVLFALGLWGFIAFELWFRKRHERGLLTPEAETTAAYLELTIKRYQRGISAVRKGYMFSVVVTAFVLTGVYAGLKSAGKLNSAASYWILGATFLYTIGVVGFVMYMQRRAAKKMQSELEYLLELQRQLFQQDDET